MLEHNTAAPSEVRARLRTHLVGAAALAAALCGCALPRLATAQSAGASNAGTLAPLVAEELATLNVKPHTATLTTDKAMTAADSLRHGDYRSAEFLAQAILSQSKLQAFSFQPWERFVSHLSLGDEPEFLDGLNQWVTHRPKSALPYLVRAKYFFDTAWLIRGNDFAAAVPVEHMQQFTANLERAEKDVRRSLALDHHIPWSHLLQLQIAAAHGDPNLQKIFLDGITRFPDYYPLYRDRLYHLTPKWGGSVSAMQQFVSQYAGNVPRSSPRNLLYMQLTEYVLNAAWVECRALKHERLTACMDAYMNRNTTSDMTNDVTKALNLYKFCDPIQFSNALWKILGDMLSDDGDTKSINTLLQLAADAMGSNTELIQDSKHNNYVIDDITARAWANLDNAQNVEQKFREALEDVERTSFANEDDKAVALGEIYDHMTGVARNASQYIKVIAYHDAANTVAGINRGGTQFHKCFAYFQLHHYHEAVDECTQLIDTHRGVLRAHVYRAWANGELKNYDAALAEYADIAEHGNENALRVSAVINLGHINVLQGNIANELAIFEKYPFVFDADIQSAEDLAVVYNNRCFAYMKLGQPQKALDDCNMSLRYGRLPDALHKQQELVKLVGGKST